MFNITEIIITLISSGSLASLATYFVTRKKSQVSFLSDQVNALAASNAELTNKVIELNRSIVSLEASVSRLKLYSCTRVDCAVRTTTDGINPFIAHDIQ